MKQLFLLMLPLIWLFSSCDKTPVEKDETPAPAKNDLRAGLIAFYPFNNNHSDESGNNYHLNAIGAVLGSDRFGVPSKAYDFDGTSSYMEIPQLMKADSLRNLTISVWIKVESVNSKCILSFLNKRDRSSCSNTIGFDNRVDSYNILHRMVRTLSSSSCSSSLIYDSIQNPIGKWSHLVLVQRCNAENTSAQRYDYIPFFNGKKLKETSTISSSSQIASSFGLGGLIGCNNSVGDPSFKFDFFKGSIDDIRIYNRALSDDEVQKLYTATN